ncbi:MAG: hypothetical protein II776_01560, partial [Clostridia bacterium]|nr:hypothetical protein [Clostridia bacterium]
MKRFVSLIMILIFLFANIWQNAAAAASIKQGLTRGVEILYEKERVRKEALFGERVRFSHKDFLPSCGEREMRGVMISRLPDGED